MGMLAGSASTPTSAKEAAGATGGDDDAWVAAAMRALDTSQQALPVKEQKEKQQGASAENVLLSRLSDEGQRTRRDAAVALSRWQARQEMRRSKLTGASPAAATGMQLELPHLGDEPTVDCIDPAWDAWLGVDGHVPDEDLPASGHQSATPVGMPAIEELVGMDGQRAQPLAWYARYARIADHRYRDRLIQLKQVALGAMAASGQASESSGEPVEPTRLPQAVREHVQAAV